MRFFQHEKKAAARPVMRCGRRNYASFSYRAKS
jgi:hypothetical protein